VAVLLPKLDEKKSIGEACLDFDRENPLNVDSTNSKRRAEGKPVRSERDGGGRAAKKARREAERSPCWAFQQKGECKFGANCRFAHPGVERSTIAPGEAAVLPTVASSADDGAGGADPAAPPAAPAAVAAPPQQSATAGEASAADVPPAAPAVHPTSTETTQ